MNIPIQRKIYRRKSAPSQNSFSTQYAAEEAGRERKDKMTENHVMNTYSRFDLNFTEGHGPWGTDGDGEESYPESLSTVWDMPRLRSWKLSGNNHKSSSIFRICTGILL